MANHELEKPHHTKAFIAVTIEEANGEKPSTRVAPQLPQLLEPNPPLTTTAAKGKKDQLQPTINHSTHGESNTLEAKEAHPLRHRHRVNRAGERTDSRTYLTDSTNGTGEQHHRREEGVGIRHPPGKL